MYGQPRIPGVGLRVAGRQDRVEKIDQCPHRARPAAEEAAKQYGQDEQDCGRQHQGDECPGGEHDAGSQQGVDAEQDVDRVLELVGAGVVGLDKQEEENQDQEDLAQAPPGDERDAACCFFHG